MGKSQRNKGASGERELFSLLSDELGIVVRRNLTQTRGGGCDTIDIPNFSLECKRCETYNFNAWWQQTIEQALRSKNKPVLFYRKSRRPWRAMFLLSDISSDFSGSDTVDVSFETACLIIRESL
tara:strand:+ start:55 stop:426 length:372 start_codon:yes stop_codon:yes gene_type:complete